MRYPRNMLGYGRTPPDPKWPGGAYVAVQVVLNYEEGGENNILHGDAASEALYRETIATLEAEGWSAVEIDYAPFRDSARLLYGGPWVGERLAAVGDFAAANLAAIDPTVRAILDGGRGQTAVDAFRGQYELAALRRRAEAEWARMDVLLLPTAPTIYRVADMLERPIELNARLGYETRAAAE